MPELLPAFQKSVQKNQLRVPGFVGSKVLFERPTANKRLPKRILSTRFIEEHETRKEIEQELRDIGKNEQGFAGNQRGRLVLMPIFNLRNIKVHRNASILGRRRVIHSWRCTLIFRRLKIGINTAFR